MFTKKRALYLAVIASLLGTLLYAEEAALKLRFSLDSNNEADKIYTVTVSGRVLDKATDQPVAGAKVRGHIIVWRAGNTKSDLFDRCPFQETTTNPKGEYQLKFETPLTLSGPMKSKDNLCIDAGTNGYETRPVYLSGKVTPQRTDFPQSDIKLEKGKEVQGLLVDESGKPVRGAIISVQSGLNGNWSFFHSLGETTTDQNGKFHFNCSTDDNLVAQNPWIQVYMPGYGVGFYFDILKKGDMGTLTLPRGGEIRGKVVGTDGKGIANCNVVAFSLWMERWHVQTDGDGNYSIAGFPGENTIMTFTERKNGKGMRDSAKVDIYAQMDPEQSLGDAPTCQIIPQDAKTLTAPDLVIGNTASVSGKLIPAKLSPPLKGLMVRLDADWGKMVEADAEGNFVFPSVPAGKHCLTIYLPNNLRGDRGIGRTDIDIQPQQKLEGISIQIDQLAEARVQILNIQGAPLEGITAGATWNRNGWGFWTEGTRSGPDGWAVLYLYPGDTQYVRGMDMDAHKLVANGFIEVNPKPGEVIDNLRVTMVPPAKINLRVVNEQDQPVKEKSLEGSIEYADGTQWADHIKTDAEGRIEIPNLTPGTVKICLTTQPVELTAAMDSLTEIKPGETKDLGILKLKPVTFHQVKGKLAGSPTFANLEGFKIRLDLKDWQPMVSTDAQGNFTIEKAPEGKHRLTAYLPFNLRTGRGVGHVEVEVKEGNLENVVLPLETLATVHLKIQDTAGKPLEGMSAAAWWTENHSGVFTEGNKSDKEGLATLYLYPDEQQYLAALDWNRAYTPKQHFELKLKAGEVKDYTVVMQTATNTPKQ